MMYRLCFGAHVHVCTANALSLCLYKGWESCVKFRPVLSYETLSDHSFAELVDLIKGGLKRTQSEVNRWQT